MNKQNETKKNENFDPQEFLGMKVINDKEKNQLTGGKRGRKRNCARCH